MEDHIYYLGEHEMRVDSYTHYSAKPIGELRNKTQIRGHVYKPSGLWVSDETDYGWKEWCKRENFGLDRLTLKYKITVDRLGILKLTSPSEILEFTRIYGEGDFILWDEVALKYKGIIITPYDWSLRLDNRTMWYYGWDCASGCIWDVDVIKSSCLMHNGLL